MGLSAVLDALKEAIVLSEKVDKLGGEVAGLAAQVRDVVKDGRTVERDLSTNHAKLSERVVRIESLIEHTKSQYSANNRAPSVNQLEEQ